MNDLNQQANLDLIANELFEQNISFEARTHIITDPEDKWLIKVEKFLRDLAEPSSNMLDEFLQICKMGKRDVLLTTEENNQVSFSKKRDYFLCRPELLDKDSDLSSLALATKSKIRQLF